MVCTSKKWAAIYFTFLYCTSLMLFSKCCAGKEATTAAVGWSFLWVIFFGLVFAGVGAYAVYKYRLRVKQLIISLFSLYPFTFICKWSHVGLDLLAVTTRMIHLLLPESNLRYHLLSELHGFGDSRHHGSVHAFG